MRRTYGAITALIVLLGIVKLCTSRNIQETIYDSEHNLFKIASPVTSEFIDNEYLERELVSKTQLVIENPLVNTYLNEWNNSGAADVLGHVFAPTVRKYQNMDIETLLGQEGIKYNPETGNYIDYIGDGSDSGYYDESDMYYEDEYYGEPGEPEMNNTSTQYFGNETPTDV